MQPLVIAVAPNGARKTKTDHPRLPLTPDELAQCAADCLGAGATMLHLHVRDPAGRHSLDADDYRAAIAAIRTRVGDALLLQVTTEAGGRYTPAEQIACVEALAPDALSIAVRELFADVGSVDDAAALLARLASRGAWVQYIAYSTADVERCAALHAEGVIPQRRPHLLFVLGSYRERRDGRPDELLPLLRELPGGWPWMACAFGATELRCVTAAALMGGHVRVGFENNLRHVSGVPAADNAELVRSTRAVLASLGLPIATALEARQAFRDL